MMMPSLTAGSGCCSERRIHAVVLDADERTNDHAPSDQVFEDGFRLVDRDGEADALGVRRTAVLMPMASPLQVEQGPAAVARVDGGVGLHQVAVRARALLFLIRYLNLAASSRLTRRR